MNAFVDSIDVPTSKSVQLIVGIWKAAHTLPMLKRWMARESAAVRY